MNHLAIKSIAGMLNLMIMMGAALFWPAGTFYYLQAWYYLFVFFASVSVITIYIFIKDKNLLQSRLKVGAMAETRKAQKVIQSFASFGFIGMYIVSGFDYRYHWSAMPQWLATFGSGMLVIAMSMLFVVFKKNTYLSATIEVKEKQQTVTSGPYAIVRHPMYSAALLLFLFSPLALGSFWALLSLPVMIVVLVFRCHDEEKALKDELAGYEDYCKNVKYRLLPLIW